MGLIAREVEAAGIPTLCMSSALSITRSVNPPRAAYLDFPLGHTTGKPQQPALQREILLDALEGFESLRAPGAVKTLPFQWSEDDGWKEPPTRRTTASPAESHRDDRNERSSEPQYQNARDRELAEAALANGDCESCVFPDGA